MSYKDQNDLKFGSDMSRFLSATCYLAALALVVGILFVVLSCFKISSYAFKTYESIDKIPYNKVGVLFGTSPLGASGAPNEFFTYRIMAASQLFKSGKIDYILVSGDNRHESYNEPRLMKRALIKAGVPAERIVFDFAGISTLDSVIRARKVFLLKSAKNRSKTSGIQYQVGPMSKVNPSLLSCRARPPKVAFFSRTVTAYPSFAR